MNLLLNSEPNNQVKILIVEDDYSLALNIEDILEYWGYTVIDIAHSGELAIEKAYQLQPNLILMNIRLYGEIDGIQAAEEIWRNLQIPIIYITGFADKITIERAQSIYPFTYLIKPIAKNELYTAIDKALNHSDVMLFRNEPISAAFPI
ncbi:response regulator [Calothrix anomala FACHB-343]|uniref:Response regulator n=3 Tax=Calotrichaceae TaxID=2661849 RepID=A0ABR8A2N7_9CYAN|nr:response regulator [Calothrix parietina FACHB-288]MBD2225007.1 response regulator [Calothrix anomala FACHB-343]